MDQLLFAMGMKDMCPETLCVMTLNGQDALDLMNHNPELIPNYILIELNLGGMNAVQFLRNIKKHKVLKRIPVIVHSSTPQPGKVKKIMASGATAIYFKEYDYFGICNMLSLYLGSEQLTLQQN